MENTRHSVVIDFDKTISGGDNFEPPTEGAVKAITRMKKNGLEIIIHTGRIKKGKDDSELKKLKEYLNKYSIPWDKIWTAQKPVAVAYIDDRGVPYQGDWQSVHDKVMQKVKKNS